ncbi:hypothetical protein EDB19DRAFT_1835747 [Suillus lakei]|nr:hypothetical protein EDB19DRAFT_1835747 [Suillus lakei]
MLEEQLETMKQERGTKQRTSERRPTTLPKAGQFVRTVALYTSLEDLIAENDRRYEELQESSTADHSDKISLQRGYIALAQALPLAASRTMSVGMLLCPAEWDWGNDLLQQSTVTIWSKACSSQRFWFRYPREQPALPDGKLNQAKVKMCVASIINIRKVSPRSIAYIVCQYFSGSVSSWRSVDGDFDYEGFWNNVVDFFKDCPGPAAQRRVTKLLEWWTRKIFGKNHRADLTPEVVSQMSVTALAEQRRALEDAAFDSD